jgi:hypothetical protein
MLITKIVRDGLKADEDRMGWLDRQKQLSKLRYGLRPRVKDFPFKGASNLSIPLSDGAIRKYKPMIMRLIVEPDPVVEFQGDDMAAVDAERDAEEMHNWLFKTHMDAFEPMAYIIDYMAHRGFAFGQVFWDYRTEYECRSISVPSLFPNGLSPQPPQLPRPGRSPPPPPPPDKQFIAQTLVQQYDLNINDKRIERPLTQAVERIAAGQQMVKIAFRKVICDKPGIADRDPVQVIMPTRATSIEDAEWVIVQHVLSLRTIKQMEADGYFEKGAVERIEKHLARPEDNRLGEKGEGARNQTPSLRSETELEDRRNREACIATVPHAVPPVAARQIRLRKDQPALALSPRNLRPPRRLPARNQRPAQCPNRQHDPA